MLALSMAVFALLFSGATLASAEDSAQANLLPAGEFQSGSGVPEGWSVDKDFMSGNVKMMDEDGQTFVRLHKAPTSMGTSADLPDGIGSVTLSTRVSLQDYEQGDKGWDNCNIMVSFLDDNGEALNDVWKEGFKFRKDQDWSDQEKTYEVPDGAKSVRVELNHKGSAGDFDIGAIVVTAE